MDMRKAFPSKYLKAADLDGKTVRVTMMGIKMEKMQGKQGEEQIKPVLYFDGNDKGLVLNKTNSDRIADEYGWETNEWRGQSILLYPTEVDAYGETVEAIRVKMPKKERSAPMGASKKPSDSGGPEGPDDDIPPPKDDEIPF